MKTDVKDAPHSLDEKKAKAEKEIAMEKKVKVKVTADPGTEGRLIDWSYDADFEGGGGSSNGNEMKFDKGPGYYKIEFSLDDETRFNLDFMEVATDAIWVATGTDCPPAGPGDGGGEILFERDPVGNKLTVINQNINEGMLCYALRFSGIRQPNPKEPGTFVPPYVFDPIMNNGGGGGGRL